MPVFDSRHLSRLKTAVSWSREKLSPFRKNRVEAIRQYVGAHYSDAGVTDRVPVNYIELAMNIYLSHLVARAPAVLAGTPHLQLKSRAYDFQLAANHLVREIDLITALRAVVQDAVFSMGILKMGLIVRGYPGEDGITHDAGQPFADSVDLDNWVHDMSVARWDHIGFCGDVYKLPLELVRECGLYDASVAGGMSADSGRSANQGESGDKAEEVSKGHSSQEENFEDEASLIDLWIPRQGVVLTLPWEGDWTKPARVVEWEGPEQGPYRRLSFSDVPNNTMPLPPVALWMDLHTLANKVFRKLGRQADRLKTILGVRGGSEDDGKRITSANDGDAVVLADPNASKEYKFGGVDGPALAFLMQVKDLFVYHAGNLDALGGLSPQAPTLGQEELLVQSASKRMGTMQDRVHDFTNGVIRGLGWYLWTDPLINLPLTKRVPGTDVEVPFRFTPERREGDFMDYNLTIESYSMQSQTPAQRLQMFGQVWQQFIAPYVPILAEQGIVVNWPTMLRKIAEYANLPEVEEFLTFANPPANAGPVQTAEGMPKPAVTTRQTVRVNRPGATRAGKDAALIQQLLGGQPQPNELAALGRPVG